MGRGRVRGWECGWRGLAHDSKRLLSVREWLGRRLRRRGTSPSTASLLRRMNGSTTSWACQTHEGHWEGEEFCCRGVTVPLHM